MTDSSSDGFQGTIGRTYSDSTPGRPDIACPALGAPNVVFVVLDDVGFSDLGCYGSEVNTPAIDVLASAGLRYNNFHVTAMCSPTRACLLTGRNAHAVGVGIISEWPNGYPGYEGRITPRAATVPEVLREYGFGTYAVGKWHLTNVENYGAAGPHDDWPLGRGFNSWYGFHGALTDQWNPDLYQDNRPIGLRAEPGYHLSNDLVDNAIGRVRDHVTSAATRPFMLYLAFGACHWPHHVPKEYIDRYRGKYDAGWDVIRSERLNRQKNLGIVPHDTLLAPRNPGVSPWEQLTPEVQRLAVRLQETYAGFLEHTDAQIGRLVNYLKAIGQFENTLIVLMSDNGASPEGGSTGAFNQRKNLLFEPEGPEVGLTHIDKIGSEYAYNHYPTGWAQVSNTPLKWYKKDTHGGGIRAPLIMHWPERIKAAGQIRNQYHHVIDIAPTLYEALGIEAPTEYRGTPQLAIQGTSALYTFDAPNEPTRKITQYFEITGDRAIWHRGWKAVARHSKGVDFDADEWELYHLDNDFSETVDLAGRHPEKVNEMIKLWWSEAQKYGVQPLDDREFERATERLKMRRTTHYTFYPDMARIDRMISPDISDRSYTIRADIEVSANGTEGVLLAWGSRLCGMSLYMQQGKPYFEYVYSDTVTYLLQGTDVLTVGPHTVVLHFERVSKSAGCATLLVDNRCIDQTSIPKTWPTHGVTTGITCGSDDGAPVSSRYTPPFPFSGILHKVSVKLANDGERSDQEPDKTLMLEE